MTQASVQIAHNLVQNYNNLFLDCFFWWIKQVVVVDELWKLDLSHTAIFLSLVMSLHSVGRSFMFTVQIEVSDSGQEIKKCQPKCQAISLNCGLTMHRTQTKLHSLLWLICYKLHHYMLYIMTVISFQISSFYSGILFYRPHEMQ